MGSRKKETVPARVSAAGYVRVSTDKQELSPEAQTEKIRAYCTLHDLQLGEVYVDRLSGKEGSMHTRPALQEVLELARRGEVDRIVVAKLDRLTRSVRDLDDIVRALERDGSHRVGLVSVAGPEIDTSSAMGRMVISLITLFAQWEREVIGERTRDIMRYMRSQGQPITQTPYGFRAIGKARVEKDGRRRKLAGMRLVKAEDEQFIIAKMLRWRRSGQTLRGIAERLTAQQVPTKKTGGSWYASTVAKVLKGAGTPVS